MRTVLSGVYFPPALAALALLASGDARAAAAGDVRSWFESTTQQLYDSVASGDRAPWDRVLDASCEITTEDGEVFDKAHFLAQMRPLPAGSSGRIKVRDLTVRVLGEAAVVHYWLDETEDISGQGLKTVYVETDAYRREHDSWMMVAMQLTVVPRDLTPVPVASRQWSALTGEYQLGASDTSRYKVFERDHSLYMGRDAGSARLLIPLAPLVFYAQGSIHIIVFVQDASGAVNELRELHKYNEVRMPRVRPASGTS
jgi:Domain of unknown function (DUF4440)